MSNPLKPYSSYLEHLDDLINLIKTYLEIYLKQMARPDFNPSDSLEKLKASWEIIFAREAATEDSSRFPILILKETFSLSFFEYLTLLLALSSEWCESLCPLYVQACGAPVPSFHLAKCFYHYTEPLESYPFESADLQHSVLQYLLLPSHQESFPSLMRQSLYLYPHILNYLTTDTIYLNDTYTDFYAYSELPDLLPLHLSTTQQLSSYLQQTLALDNIPRQILFLYGPKGVGKKTVIQTACASLNLSILYINLDALMRLSSDALEIYIKSLCFKQLITKCMVCLTHFTESTKELALQLLNTLLPLSSFIFICSLHQLPASFSLPYHSNLLAIPLSLPSAEERFTIWSFLTQYYPLDVDLITCATKYHFTIGKLIDLLSDCKLLAQYYGLPAITQDLLTQSLLAKQSVSLYTHLVQTPYTFSDLVLEESTLLLLQQIFNWVSHHYTVFYTWHYAQKFAYGRGLSLLFYGAPGTGKTMAASVLANAWGLNLFKVNLAQIADKYIGETEKKLDELFDLAETANFVLLFDEADSLFAKRTEVTSSHDKYANLETAYLLQKLEHYTGIVILSTNLIQNLDEAFRRRLQFIVRFNLPTADLREKLWKSAFSPDSPLAPDIDFKQLSLKYDLSPSDIKSIALNSAFLAATDSTPINQSHILQSIKAEYDKKGKLMPPLT